jgi:hypothetical protein
MKATDPAGRGAAMGSSTRAVAARLVVFAAVVFGIVVFTVLLLGDCFGDFFDVGLAGRARVAGSAGVVTCSVVFFVAAADFFAVVPEVFLAFAVVRLVRVAAVSVRLRVTVDLPCGALPVARPVRLDPRLMTHAPA